LPLSNHPYLSLSLWERVRVADFHIPLSLRERVRVRVADFHIPLSLRERVRVRVAEGSQWQLKKLWNCNI